MKTTIHAMYNNGMIMCGKKVIKQKHVVQLNLPTNKRPKTLKIRKYSNMKSYFLVHVFSTPTPTPLEFC
jgi:hypothetical protein